jgi:hypothetical protein
MRQENEFLENSLDCLSIDDSFVSVVALLVLVLERVLLGVEYHQMLVVVCLLGVVASLVVLDLLYTFALLGYYLFEGT